MTMDLYMKAGPKGDDVGDCPFAQYVRCVLNHKGVLCQIHPCTKETKPDWLLKDFDGKMPCLMHDGKGIVESSDIANYIDESFPEKPLKAPEEVSAKASGFFPAAAKLCASVPENSELENKFLTECKVLEELLSSGGGPYLAGSSETLIDYSLAPKLYHITSVLPEFHPKVNEKFKSDYPLLNAYAERMFKHPSFEGTTYDRQLVIDAWKAKRESS